MTDPVKEETVSGEMSKSPELLEREAEGDALAAESEQTAPNNSAGNQHPDHAALSIFNTVILACQGSGTLMESNERQISVGIGLIASVIDKSSLQQAKAAVINRVINELVQVAGIQLRQNDQLTGADAPAEA